MKDFAKLFRLPDIGQVLLYLKEDEDTELPVVVIRISDAQGIEITQRMRPKGDSYDDVERHTEAIFDRITEDNILDYIGPMIAARNKLLNDD